MIINFWDSQAKKAQLKTLTVTTTFFTLSKFINSFNTLSTKLKPILQKLEKKIKNNPTKKCKREKKIAVRS